MAKRVARKTTAKKAAAKGTKAKSASRGASARGASGSLESRKSDVVRAPRGSKVVTVRVKPDANRVFKAPAEVERVVAVLGSNTVADLLQVSHSQPSRWRAGEERLSPANRARLVDLDHVLNRLLQVLWPEEASAWLTAQNPHLGGRPVDVLAICGGGPVIDAIDALAQGAYA